MEAEYDPVLGTTFRERPHCQDTIGIGFNVVDTAGLRRYIAPVLEHKSQLVERHVRTSCKYRRPVAKEGLQFFGSRARHHSLH
jgi:hypothetical protein